MAHLSSELVLVKCPCRCKSQLLFRKMQSGTFVRCPNTGRRIRLAGWQPFGKKQWDAARGLGLLRDALRQLRIDVGDRRSRLLAAAVGRNCLGWSHSQHLRSAVAFAEARADGGPEPDADAIKAWLVARADRWTTGIDTGDQVAEVAIACVEVTPRLAFPTLEAVYGVGVSQAFRDVVRNPFDTATFEPGWRTEVVRNLAENAYRDRAFDVLPVLADAIEEAGCPHRDLLDHLRGPGPHFRGCWALDVVLGHS